jgi:AcrR family transcriptional regulator
VSRIPAAERRQQLIDAAFRVIERDGVPAATTRAIAAEAGAPLASFHYCFASKEELLRELTPTLVNRMLEAAIAGIEPGRSVRDMLREGVRSMWEAAEATRDEQHVLYELTQYALRSPGLEDLAVWQYERYYEEGIRYLEDVSAAAGTEWSVPLPVVSRLLVSFVDGLVLGWVVDGNSADAGAAVDAFIEGLCLLAVPAP